MQRKCNTISEKIQTGNQETFGIDMGGTLWATAIRDWESGKNSYYGLKDKEQLSKEEALQAVCFLLGSVEREAHRK